MPIPILYVDTSVVGGMFDQAFEKGSALFWQQAREGRFRVLISPLVREELAGAPTQVRRFFEDQVISFAESVDLTEEAEDLADAYLQANVVSKEYRDDALHVAVATISNARALVRWNYRHLVNVHREDAFNGVNLLQGYPTIRIVSPLEVVEYAQ